MIRDMSTTDPVLIGLCGAAGSGKSSAADVLCREYGFVQVAFADALRDMLCGLLAAQGIDHAWVTEPRLKERPIAALGVSGRRLMQTLGDWGRSLDPDWWVQALARSIGLADRLPPGTATAHDRIVISDVRYPNEAAWLRSRGGVLVHISREDAQAPASTAAHSSEQHHALLGADVGLHNHGPTLEGLAGLVRALAADLNLEPREGMQ